MEVAVKTLKGIWVASFPPPEFDHLQYAIIAWKAWEIWHHPHVSTLCLPDVITHNQIRVPCRPSDQILVVGMAWNGASM